MVSRSPLIKNNQNFLKEFFGENKIKSKYLSNEERETGTKFFLFSTLCNGLGISFLATTIVQLLAIHFGANNYHIGFINSIMQVSGVLLLFIPALIRGKNLVKVYSLFWFIRGLFILLNITTLFLPDNLALIVVIITYTLFCFSRIISFSTFESIRRMISTPYTRGEIILKTGLRFNMSVLAGSITSLAIVSIPFFSGLFGLISIQLVGVIVNSLAAYFMTKIPCRDVAEKGSGLNILKLLKINMSHRITSITLIQNWICQSQMVLAGFFIALLKKIFMFPHDRVILYTVVSAIAGILALHLTRPFIDKISSRPILFIVSLVQGVLFILWIFIKETTPIPFIFILGFTTAFTNNIVPSYTGKNVIQIMPEDDKISFNAMQNVTSAIFVFLIGGMLAGFFGDLGEGVFRVERLNPYYLIFLLSALLAFLNAIVSLFYKVKDDYSINQTMKLFLSIKNLRAYLASYYLSITFNRKKRFKYINIIKNIDSPYAVEEMRKLLYNPLTPETQDILTALYFIPRPQLLPDIIKIADDSQSYRRDRAIFTLGAYPAADVENKLIQYLKEENPLIQSTAAKSLARIGSQNYLHEVIRLSKKDGYSTWVRMNYIIALGTMDKKGEYLKDLFILCNCNTATSCNQSLYSTVARQLDMDPPLNLIYQKENLIPFGGLNTLLEECRQFTHFYEAYNTILSNFSHNEYLSILDWCRKTLHDYQCENYHMFLKMAILDFPYNRLDKDDTLAVLYFTFQVSLASKRIDTE